MTMLSVAAARERARSRLNSSMAAWASEGTDEVRVEIALRPPTEKQVLTDQAAAADWAASWRAVEDQRAARRQDQRAAATTPGLEIDWQTRDWARVGRQSVPVRLRLLTPDEVAAFVGGDPARDWRTLRERGATVRELIRAAGAADAIENVGVQDAVTEDAAASAIRSQSKRILRLTADAFAAVIDTVAWLAANPVGSLRPRQLPIRGVDSKWFEAHRSLVTALLAAAGHADAVRVIDAEPRMRMRLLDPALAPAGLTDLTVSITEASRLPIAPRVVFVFENLESVLSMPDWPAAVAVHGAGYAVDAVARLSWISRARVLYWGDLDSHGFAILSRLRTRLPEVESVLMDEPTLLAHRDLWVTEPNPHRGSFAGLTDPENRTLELIRAEGDVRLEQERIPWSLAVERLRGLVEGVGPPRRGGGSAHERSGIDYRR